MKIDIEHIKESVLPILIQHGVGKAALFGSAATDQMEPESDIDLLVRIDRDISLLEFVGLKLELEGALNRKVDLVEYETIKPQLKDRIINQQRVIL